MSSTSPREHGCGTLEMMRRVEQPILSSRMAFEIQRHRSQHQRQSDRKQHSDYSPITGKGEIQARGGKLHGLVREPPEMKRLVGGRLQRVMEDQLELDDEDCRGSEINDVASTRSSLRSCTDRSRRSSEKSNRFSVDSRIEELRQLQQEQLDLEEELLNVTKKMNHKFNSKKSDRFQSKRGDKIKEIARMWSDSDLESQEKYEAYMKARYTTHTQVQYHNKKKDKFNVAKFHRQRNIHSKYGNELVKCKISLRGAF